MRPLPIGAQHFALLRESNKIYVDKTEKIHELMNVGRFVFLARPRRFGKSLLTTTLRAIYEGRRELFEGLWIEDKIDWVPRPVILINFNNINYTKCCLKDHEFIVPSTLAKATYSWYLLGHLVLC